MVAAAVAVAPVVRSTASQHPCRLRDGENRLGFAVLSAPRRPTLQWPKRTHRSPKSVVCFAGDDQPRHDGSGTAVPCPAVSALRPFRPEDGPLPCNAPLPGDGPAPSGGTAPRDDPPTCRTGQAQTRMRPPSR